ncbi:MAG: HAD family hydrolase [Candidatus Nephthysia bennettiae]|uniref:HAD family hydrolase n=1 Tax=Candidatus Nephthysia bennettiae TaxID=3127016 RepID=A0A934K4F5_9BACT|nr:HAD family hydrolase [Candidatus Dormibacteraeota bacterium]MBJ7611533.1 HAD family hydrolase [Candidatus Dormibacteraeota bacterium]PZS00258.1 MAG: HAD family hydrolase [Candidatus Dormibacteraeota bacterium]
MNRGVIFDVDGTLVDSNYLHALAWYRTFAEIGEQVPMYRIHRAIGMGSQQLIKDLIGRDEPELSDRHSQQYRKVRDEARAFEKAADLLREIAGRGGRVMLATSAKPEELEVLLATLDAGDAIHGVVSSKDVEAAKPEPDIFARALEVGELEPSHAVAVGDSVWDIASAGRCGLRCVSLLTGGTGGCELEEAGAAEVYSAPAELLRRLDSSLVGSVLAGGVVA